MENYMFTTVNHNYSTNNFLFTPAIQDKFSPYKSFHVTVLIPTPASLFPLYSILDLPEIKITVAGPDHLFLFPCFKFSLLKKAL